MDKSKKVLNYFPDNIKYMFNFITETQWKKVNEICFIVGQPISMQLNGRRCFLGFGSLVYDTEDIYTVTKNDIHRIYELITKSSVFAYNRFISNGFLTLEGGNRVGICGDCILNGGVVTNISAINSLSFRISHNISPNIDFIFDEIYSDGMVSNIVIISPPGCGKTTFLRAVASSLSKKQKDGRIIKCVIIDERYEIAACDDGIATLNVGQISPVISGCIRSIAIPMVVRSMSPDVIFTDEIASTDDINAIKYAKASGCSIIATTHGLNENNNELSFFDINNLFDKIVVLSSRNGPGTIEKILGGENK